MKLHMVSDNRATRTHSRVKGRRERHPCFVLHFIPTGSSWSNPNKTPVWRTDRGKIRRGIFVGVPALIAAIGEYRAAWDENPKPFIWTATVKWRNLPVADRLRKRLPGCMIYNA